VPAAKKPPATEGALGEDPPPPPAAPAAEKPPAAERALGEEPPPPPAAPAAAAENPFTAAASVSWLINNMNTGPAAAAEVAPRTKRVRAYVRIF